jgi:hypothetical protein
MLLKFSNYFNVYEVSNSGSNDKLIKRMCYISKSLCQGITSLLKLFSNKVDPFSDDDAQKLLYYWPN